MLEFIINFSKRFYAFPGDLRTLSTYYRPEKLSRSDST